MPHRVADRFLRNAQQLVLVLGLEPGDDARTLERAAHSPGYGGALGQLTQRQLQSRAARLIQTQRHDRAARLGEPIARELTDARECDRQLRAALAAGGKLLYGAKLQQDPG